MPKTDRDEEYEERLLASEERLRLGEIAGGIATFEYDNASSAWNWSAQAAPIFELNEHKLEHWEKAVFVVRVGRGTWGLKEWYPGRSFKSKDDE
jgi:hypothetical protein